MFPGQKWTTEIAQIPASPIAATSRASVLRYLGLLREKVTGARPLSTPLPSNDLTLAEFRERDIIEGLALEVYLDRDEDSWVVAPERFFKRTACPTGIPSLAYPPEQ